MLVLSRKAGERITVGNDIEVVVLGIAHGRVRLGFAAPAEVTIRRSEVEQRIVVRELSFAESGEHLL